MFRKAIGSVMVLAALTLLSAIPAFATNGDNLISVGPTSRAMGGVGIAAPQDAVSAVFSNPAAMCFGPFCPSTKIDLSTTFFMPKVDAELNRADGDFHVDSKEKAYIIPSAGFSMPLSDTEPFWRIGFAAYGVSGMGVNYRETDFSDPDAYGYPRAAGTFTELQRMKAAPTIAVKPYDWLSLGLSVHLHYASLDLGQGSKGGMTVGFQPGVIVKPWEGLSIGLTYVSPQLITHKDVSDFDWDGEMDDLDLEAPQMFGFGVAYEWAELGLLLEADARWYNWSDAKGYKDFDWDDQWAFGVGAQWRLSQRFALRAGYNYASNPVKNHGNFDGQAPIEVQGHMMPTYYYETFRVIGFPAIVEQHVTLGFEWEWFEHFYFSMSYMHAFSNTITEDGTDIYGMPVSVSSTLSEDSIGVGFSYVF